MPVPISSLSVVSTFLFFCGFGFESQLEERWERKLEGRPVDEDQQSDCYGQEEADVDDQVRGTLYAGGGAERPAQGCSTPEQRSRLRLSASARHIWSSSERHNDLPPISAFPPTAYEFKAAVLGALKTALEKAHGLKAGLH